MSDDICGAETADGSPCEHPTTADGDADRCWIDAHNEADTESGDPGRPSKLEDRRGDVLTGARQGMTIEGCARLAGVSKDTLYRWLDEHDEFSDAFKRARAQGELKHLQSVNDSGSRFVLERSFGYTKTEKRELDHSGEIDVDHEHDLDEATREAFRAALRERRGGDT